MERLQYLGLMGACLAITLPLEFVFRARVYRRPIRFVRALGPAFVLFVVWDVIAIQRGHWWFTERYVTGLRAPGNIPIEELAFFVAIPICAVLTFEASRRTLRR